MNETEKSHHDLLRRKIHFACLNAGLSSKEESGGNGWRADVLALDGERKFAFEVQLTRQTLTRTLERQQKYIRDGIVGCWFFESEPHNFKEERIDLPLFQIADRSGEMIVSLKNRQELLITQFISDFTSGKMEFRPTLSTTRKQRVEISFVEMNCWKCNALNHIYFANRGFFSSCNAILERHEMLWASERKEYNPEILKAVRDFISQNPGKNLVLGNIEERLSKTVGHSYTSFGCASCNAIFGDHFVNEAQIESLYGDGVIAKFFCELEMNIALVAQIPHWCHPGDGKFCG